MKLEMLLLTCTKQLVKLYNVIGIPNFKRLKWPSWSWSYGSWRGVLDTTLCDQVCQWFTTGRWFSL